MNNYRFYDEEFLVSVLDSLVEIPEIYLKNRGDVEYKQITQDKMKELLSVPEDHSPCKYKKQLDLLCEDLGAMTGKDVYFQKKRIWFWVGFSGKFKGYKKDLSKLYKEQEKHKKLIEKEAKDNGTYGINNPNCKGGIYLIESSGFYKIGKSNDISKRLSSLRTGNPNEMVVVCTYYPTNSSLDKLERDLHEKFAESRTTGEWFKKDFTIEQFIEECLSFNNKGRTRW